ncbi:Rpn family recombination-promoting nuclease/putative transposase [Spirosoma foliorum]|uniref:Rpn family recombination-promoting nuclease/putative transposase n=1 Tax=Spirosoma foliorum TaxID=2710596 RepID=A0A7G5H6R7_9BACT|nr:Rpn family recombination-promoting nuclease/putative transposase [Spirosoma foliorum]
METSDYRFIPIISDYGFKATFGNETNTLFLRRSLQALTKSAIPIRDIQFEKNAFEALTIDSRSGIYDLACTDEKGNQFIVEMQLAHSPNFIQRMKFYTLHKFNTLVERGQFDYSNLPKIYCIAFLEKSILPTMNYHTIANLRSESGELVDSQISFIIIELAKFDIEAATIQTDLEKLIFTMKTLHTVTEATQYPAFWNEEWLKKAIDELDTRKMSPEERFQFARITAINAEAVNEEKRKIEEMKTEAVKKALIRQKLSIEEIAEDNDVSIDFVLSVQNQFEDQ